MTDPSFDQIIAAHGSGPVADETAITYPGERLSWAELDTRGAARARRPVSLRGDAVHPADQVAGHELAQVIGMPRSYEVVTGALRSDAGKVRRAALRDERLTWLQEGKRFQLAR